MPSIIEYFTRYSVKFRNNDYTLILESDYSRKISGVRKNTDETIVISNDSLIKKCIKQNDERIKKYEEAIAKLPSPIMPKFIA